jgi:pyruvate kinase
MARSPIMRGAWRAVREAARQAGRYVGVLGDLQGPKIRIDRFVNGKVQLADGAEFTLDAALAVDAGTEATSESPTRNCRRMCSRATCCC